MLKKVGNFFVNLVWFVRHRTIDRFNIIKIKSLKPDYYEYYERMLHGCFALLLEYVKELGYGCEKRGLSYLDEEIEGGIEDNIEESMRKSQREYEKIVKELYLWWVFERPKRVNPWDLVDHVNWTIPIVFDRTKPEIVLWESQCKAAEEEKERQNEEDNLMLQKLISIRLFLWC
jgi:hypothetical protein